MSIHELFQQNFSIAGRQIRTLNINLPGYVLVFFKMETCTSCKAVEPIFFQLANEKKNINYAIVNLTNNREIVNMSRQTTTPITAVPFIILYTNGSPHAKYTGKKSIPNMKSFIDKAMATVDQNFSQKNQQKGMYGYSQPPPIGPQQGHAGYNPTHGPYQQSGKPKSWQPEIGKAPSMQSVIKNRSDTQYAYLNDVDEEDDEKLFIPEQIIPHNVPWEGGYKKLGTLD